MKLNLSSFFKKEFIILYVVILIGAFLRLEGVFTNSFAFTYDVGRDMLSLWEIVYNHKIILIGATTGIPGVFYGPWWYYLLSPFFLIFSGDPQGIALIMAIIGILSIPLFYIFGKRRGGRFLGLSLALLTSVSPSLISLSSQIWNPNIAPFFVLLVLLVLERIYTLKNKVKSYYFFALGLLLALNIDIEILWGILFSIGVLVSFFILYRKSVNLKKILYLFFGALIILSPRIIFELRHSFIMTKSFLAFLSDKTIDQKVDFYRFLENRTLFHIDEFSKTFIQANNIISILIFVFTIFIAILLYKKGSLLIKQFTLTSIIILIVFYVGSFIFPHALWPHYFVGLPIIYILLFCLSLYLLKVKLKNNLIPGLILAVLFVLTINSMSVIQNLNKPLWQGDASVYRNQLEVIDYAYMEANGKPFKYVTYTPPVYDYTYQYLFKWYGKNKYKYEPVVEAPTAFFILEPDPGYEDRANQWLKQREGDGKIIKSTTLKSGIVVQTRVH
jgi:4-amino-4-deoxy-L-arabinose transferase-like glycosyltransferase